MIPAGQPHPTARRVWLVALALALVVATIFHPVTQLPFISLDDPDYVSDNPHVSAGLTWAGVKWAFTTTHACNWHPLTWLSHMVDMSLFGPGPRAPHSTNLALHTASAVLLLLLLHRLTGSLWRSVCVAALFALHPLRIESVAWVAERKDVLSAFFFLLTLYSYSYYTSRPQPRTGPYLCTLGLFALGLLSKPMLVTLPCVLLLLDVWPLGRASFSRPLLREKIPFFILSAASSFATYHAQQQGGAVRTFTSLSFGQRLENAGVALARYIELTFRPIDLAPYYPHPGHWPATTIALAALPLAIVTFLALHRAATRPFIPVGWFWFIGMLVPVIGLVQVGSQSMADRYTYLPSIGLFIFLIWTTASFVQHRRFLKIFPTFLLGLALVALAASTRTQLRHWRDSETLFRHTLAVTSANFVAHYNLGSTLLQLGRLDEAREQFEKTLALHPRYAEAHVDLGNTLLRLNQPQEAITRYRQAISLNPRLANAHYNLGTTLLQLGHLDESIAALEKASAEQPDSALTNLNLGTAFLQKSDLTKSIYYLQAAVSLQPALADAHCNLGLALLQSGQPEQACNHLETALKITPDHAFAHYHLGTLLLQQNQPAPAARHFEKSLASNPDDPDTHSNLAFALLQSGRPTDAAAVLERALALPEAKANPTLREALQQQLATCQSPAK